VKTEQTLIRNGKTYTFFPDILIDDHVKGFLVDISNSVILKIISELWVNYNRTCVSDAANPHYFSISIAEVVSDGDNQKLFEYYVALPTNQVITSGEPLVSFCSIVKKHRM
jgi:hypothetical protein